MKMSEQPTVESEIFVQAPPERVWALVTDIVMMGQWSPEYRGGKWLDDASGPEVGAKFIGINKRHERQWESVSTVVEVEPGQSFAWAVGDPSNAAATWRFDLIPEGDGTRVRQYARLGPGPSGLTHRIAEIPEKEEQIVAARVDEHRRNMELTLRGLKTAVERDP